MVTCYSQAQAQAQAPAPRDRVAFIAAM